MLKHLAFFLLQVSVVFPVIINRELNLVHKCLSKQNDHNCDMECWKLENLKEDQDCASLTTVAYNLSLVISGPFHRLPMFSNIEIQQYLRTIFQTRVDVDALPSTSNRKYTGDLTVHATVILKCCPQCEYRFEKVLSRLQKFSGPYKVELEEEVLSSRRNKMIFIGISGGIFLIYLIWMCWTFWNDRNENFDEEHMENPVVLYNTWLEKSDMPDSNLLS